MIAQPCFMARCCLHLPIKQWSSLHSWDSIALRPQIGQIDPYSKMFLGEVSSNHSLNAKQVKEAHSLLLVSLPFSFQCTWQAFKEQNILYHAPLQCQIEQVSNWGWGLDGSAKTTDLQLAAMMNLYPYLHVITLMQSLSFWNLSRQLYQNTHEKTDFFASYKLLWKKSAI